MRLYSDPWPCPARPRTGLFVQWFALWRCLGSRGGRNCCRGGGRFGDGEPYSRAILWRGGCESILLVLAWRALDEDTHSCHRTNGVRDEDEDILSSLLVGGSTRSVCWAIMTAYATGFSWPITPLVPVLCLHSYYCSWVQRKESATRYELGEG